MANLDYIKVVGRLGIVVADSSSDPDKMPDIAWVNSGEVLFVPFLSVTKVVNHDEGPATLRHFPIRATFDNEGYLALEGERFVNLVDLTDPDLDPFIQPGLPTHTMEFSGLEVSGQTLDLPSTKGRFAPDMLFNGVVDISSF